VILVEPPPRRWPGRKISQQRCPTVVYLPTAGHALEDIVLLQFPFYLDPPEGHRLGGDTIDYSSTTLDLAIGHAETMLQERTFSFGKANLCLIRDQDGKVIREVRGRRK
jgi:hypothetical protein